MAEMGAIDGSTKITQKKKHQMDFFMQTVVLWSLSQHCHEEVIDILYLYRLWDARFNFSSNTSLHLPFFVFRSTEDIDLYVGGIAERPVPGGNVGRTFGCIIGYQFRDLRKGDKYWFENPTQFSQGEVIVFGFCSFQVHY